jgi:hypothetical protein
MLNLLFSEPEAVDITPDTAVAAPAVLCRYGPARQELMKMDTARQLLKSSLEVGLQNNKPLHAFGPILCWTHDVWLC